MELKAINDTPSKLPNHFTPLIDSFDFDYDPRFDYPCLKMKLIKFIKLKYRIKVLI